MSQGLDVRQPISIPCAIIALNPTYWYFILYMYVYNACLCTFRIRKAPVCVFSPVCRMLRLLASCLLTGMVTDAAVEQLCAGGEGVSIEISIHWGTRYRPQYTMIINMGLYRIGGFGVWGGGIRIVPSTL